MKCQILFSGKIRKNIIYLSSAEFAHSVLSVKYMGCGSDLDQMPQDIASDQG